MPPLMNNHGNYIVSLGNVARWLATPPLQRALYLAVGVMFGVVVYGAALYATGVRPADLRNRSASV